MRPSTILELRGMMNLIDECKADLEKILGFSVAIKTRQFRNEWGDTTIRDFGFVKDEQKPIQFMICMQDRPIPTRENSWYDGWVSRFNLQQLPACCGILLSTNSSVHPRYRGKGVATRLNAFRRAIALHEGYSLLLCTDKASNTAQSKVLEKNGWKNVHQFTNARTGNSLNISVSEILRPHIFSYPDAPNIGEVHVFGDFDHSNWKWGTRMALRDGMWTARIYVPPGKKFQYKFVIDKDTWVTDPQNPKTVPNGLGGYNSVIDA